MNYSEFTLRRHLRTYTTYIRRNGKGYRLYNGKLITEEAFNKATEMPQRPFICELNPCKKYNYLNVEGSVIDNLKALCK